MIKIINAATVYEAAQDIQTLNVPDGYVIKDVKRMDPDTALYLVILERDLHEVIQAIYGAVSRLDKEQSY